MTFELFIVSLSFMINVVVGLFVFSRSPHNAINKGFAVLASAATLFLIANHLSLHADNRLFYIRSVLFFVVITMSSLLFVVRHMTDQNSALTKTNLLGVVLTVVLLAITFTPLLFSGLTQTDNPVPIANIGAPLFPLHLIGFTYASFALLQKEIKRQSPNRAIYRIMQLGILPMLVLGPFTGFVMPVILENTTLVFLSPIYATIFVSTVGYSIVRYGLFDIRPLVVKSVAYILTLSLVSTTYILLLIALLNSISAFTDISFTTSQQLAYIAALVVSASALIPLKSYFDKLSNRLFHQNTENPQSLLRKLSTIAITRKSSDELLHEYKETITSSLNISDTVFIINSQDDSLRPELNKIVGSFMNQSESILSVQSTRISDDIRELFANLKDQGFEVLIKLIGQNKTHGVMLVGYKNSGSSYSDDEIKVLETIASELSLALESTEQFQEIQQFNKQLQAKVDSATKELRTLDEAKDTFIQLATHQLRSPVSATLHSLELLKLRPDSEITDLAITSTKRTKDLIDEMLTVTKASMGKLELTPKAHDLAKLITVRVKAAKGLADKSNTKLITKSPKSLELTFDKRLITEVVANLIENAIQYSPAGSEITIELGIKKNNAVLNITNPGPGIPKAEQAKVFNKFYRGQKTSKTTEGTGLGLFLAKQVIEEHKGKMILKSTSGKKTTIGFTLPLS